MSIFFTLAIWSLFLTYICYIFLFQIRIRPPNAKGRLDILKVHARKVKLSDTVDLATYAQNLPGIQLLFLLVHKRSSSSQSFLNGGLAFQDGQVQS